MKPVDYSQRPRFSSNFHARYLPFLSSIHRCIHSFHRAILHLAHHHVAVCIHVMVRVESIKHRPCHWSLLGKRQIKTLALTKYLGRGFPSKNRRNGDSVSLVVYTECPNIEHFISWKSKSKRNIFFIYCFWSKNIWKEFFSFKNQFSRKLNSIFRYFFDSVKSPFFKKGFTRQNFLFFCLFLNVFNY